jgi:hypothetical protein
VVPPAFAVGNGLWLAITGEPAPPYGEMKSSPLRGVLALAGRRRGFDRLDLLPRTIRQLSAQAKGLIFSALVLL